MKPSAERSCAKRSYLLGVVGALVLTLVSASAAADDRQDAKVVYDLGVEAANAGDAQTAAALFARADELAPNPIALAAAIRAVVVAGDETLGRQLLTRAEAREPLSDDLQRAVDSARNDLLVDRGVLRVECAGCAVSVDGERQALSRIPVVAGPHLVELRLNGKREKQLVTVTLDQTSVVRPRWVAKRQPERTPAKRPGHSEHKQDDLGVSTGWFWVSGSVTLALGAATAVSAVDMYSQQRAFVDDPTQTRAADGESAQLRTHALIGAVGAAALTTAVVGIFVVDWEAPVEVVGDVDPDGETASIGLAGTF